MKLKVRITDRKPCDITAWNDEIEAFIKPLNGFEALVFNDYFITFFNKNNDFETRFEAGFNAAKMTLVDANNESIIVDEDKEVFKNASFAPYYNLFATGLTTNADGVVETAKKN